MVGSRTSAVLLVGLLLSIDTAVKAQMLEPQLLAESAGELAKTARQAGDAQRGAILFHQAQLACGKCHLVGSDGPNPNPGLGPDLTRLPADVTDLQLVESVLQPSKQIRQGYETAAVITADGRTIHGVLVSRAADKVVLRDAARFGEAASFAAADVEEIRSIPLSLMPAGQVNQLTSRQQFLDLLRYVFEIRDGGPERARQLQPPATLLAFTLPEYEERLDHAGLIGDWGAESLRRGEKLYQRVCANCHGTRELPGSLPTSLRFAEGKFKNGSDPLSLYRTVTRGFGLMAPQTWMVPRQKYDVIHYIRETYLKPHNPAQFVVADANYLQSLPRGDTRGPEPSNIDPWVVMDYGPSLINTYEFPALAGDARPNLAYKGIAIRLDPGPGGVSRGRQWMVFDHDTLRWAGAWSASDAPNASPFIDWGGIQFDGQHGVHPHVSGDVAWTNPVGPGWARPDDLSFADDARVVGRDGRSYGPLPRPWAHYRGLYHHDHQTVIAYRLDDSCDILELPRLAQRPVKTAVTKSGSRGELSPEKRASADPASATASARGAAPLFARQFQIGPRRRPLVVNIAQYPGTESRPVVRAMASGTSNVVLLAPVSVPAAAGTAETPPETPPDAQPLRFDGNTYAEVAAGGDFDVTATDYSITARLRTKSGGTVLALAPPGPKWAPDGQTLFVRDGRLCFDIGWVGAVVSKKRVNDGQWHDVALTWQRGERRVRLFVDGKLDGEGTLAAKGKLAPSVLRLGFTAPDFPRPDTFFKGELSRVRFYQRRLDDAELAGPWPEKDANLIGDWSVGEAVGERVVDRSGRKHDAEVRRGGQAERTGANLAVVAGVVPKETPVEWQLGDNGQLQLKIPSGDAPLRFTVWTTRLADPGLESPSAGTNGALAVERLALDLAQSVYVEEPASDLERLTRGGPPRWPQKLPAPVTLGAATGPLAVDILAQPVNNPWFAQLRLTGFDFYPDGDRAAVCSWDGDVWLVTGLKGLDPAEAPSDDGAAPSPPRTATLTWQRIASGLFQPLGLKIVAGKIHLTCRDQLVVLHDLNGDGETDYYENLNNDHQVTEHFHEFAMGLQTDAAGNFYYAKSARHALKAVVPHHGTLLRVSRDGTRTDILATGFRAANGVCLNPDGTFIVTDQEGHWNPKNRINWVNGTGPSEFFGNMYGYHDVTDSSDAAMSQPLCWITNAFDRSPAELLWVTSDRWGPLRGSLLNLSYGYGKIYVVPHEKVNGQVQGGMCELPLPIFPTGLIRGRFHPVDGQLYACGMFAWASSATQPGGFYRVRYTGQPVHVPVGLSARQGELQIDFSGELERQSVAELANYALKTWSLKRSANYGSNHYDERPLRIKSATLSEDRKSIRLEIPELAPTWCMEIKYGLRGATGVPVQGTIHHTIHNLGKR